MSNSAYGILPSRPIISAQTFIPTTCPHCNSPVEFPLPAPQPRQGTILQIRCCACTTVLSHAFYPSQIPSTSSVNGDSARSSRSNRNSTGTPQPQPQTQRKGRKIGTQERPLETGYYDVLGVSVTATGDEIKKAYRRLAIKHHPDKNRDDPHAEERFKEIALAYHTLSDDALRRRYNEFGARETEGADGAFVDPEAVFAGLFGGDRFEPLIGEISLARDMKSALQEAEEAEEEMAGGGAGAKDKNKNLSEEERARREDKKRKKAEEKAAAREERVHHLVDNLIRKLSIFTESATGPDDRDVTQSWRTICELEAEELKKESYGVELLQSIGFVYASKAKHHLATNQTFFGVGGWLHNVQGKYHVFSETVSTLRAAIELKSVFDQIQAAEKAGNLSPDEKRKLEEQAAEKGLQALFKGTKLEIESILRETCDRVLADAAVPPNKLTLRAVAMQILGEAFMNTRKDAEGGGEIEEGERERERDAEYVRVETKASRARTESTRGPGTPRMGPGMGMGR